MSGNTVRIFTVSVLLMAGGVHAPAQTDAPPENVTVTASKSRAVFHNFTNALATPAVTTGKIARWERRVCPLVVGQNHNFTAFITQRVKYIALTVGAPVNTEASCKPNVEIVFTTAPQALLDNVRKNEPDYLGYATSNAQRDVLATVTKPVQVWYMTETVDWNGMRMVDSGMPLGEEIKWIKSNGNRINNGIHSGFNHILIVIDTTKLAGHTIVPLADYISMVALTQVGSLDACQPLPSIVNILVEGCKQVEDRITQFDLAYLHGLYRLEADRILVAQRNDIADATADTLAKAK